MDIDNIPFGFDFRDQIGIAARSAQVLLVVISENWLAPLGDGRSRILDENDSLSIIRRRWSI
jgi:hypothetical protein